MTRMALATVLAVAMGVPGTAQAQRGVAPPGNAEIDQYVESVPDAKGDRPSRSGIDKINARRVGSAPAVAPGTATRARALGPDGRRAVEIAAAFPGRSDGKSDARADSKGRGPLSTVAKGLTGGGDGSVGAGLVLPIVLLLTILVAAAVALGRRERTSKT